MTFRERLNQLRTSIAKQPEPPIVGSVIYRDTNQRLDFTDPQEYLKALENAFDNNLKNMLDNVSVRPWTNERFSDDPELVKAEDNILEAAERKQQITAPIESKIKVGNVFRHEMIGIKEISLAHEELMNSLAHGVEYDTSMEVITGEEAFKITNISDDGNDITTDDAKTWDREDFVYFLWGCAHVNGNLYVKEGPKEMILDDTTWRPVTHPLKSMEEITPKLDVEKLDASLNTQREPAPASHSPTQKEPEPDIAPGF